MSRFRSFQGKFSFFYKLRQFCSKAFLGCQQFIKYKERREGVWMVVEASTKKLHLPITSTALFSFLRFVMRKDWKTCLNAEKIYFDQRMAHKAPICCLKNTTGLQVNYWRI